MSDTSRASPARAPRPARGVARWVREPYCGLSHAAGAAAALVGLTLLLVFTQGGPARYVAISVYGASLFFLFAASALAHGLHVSPRVSDRLDRLDYAAIFFLIAGTYTPICLTVLAGPWGYSLLSIEWTIALAGAGLVLWTRVPRLSITLLYLPMSWLLLVAIVPTMRLLPTSGLIGLFVGGALYTAGAVVFLTQRPRLWPGQFGSHDLWHTMVLLAAGCHFMTVVSVAV